MVCCLHFLFVKQCCFFFSSPNISSSITIQVNKFHTFRYRTLKTNAMRWIFNIYVFWLKYFFYARKEKDISQWKNPILTLQLENIHHLSFLDLDIFKRFQNTLIQNTCKLFYIIKYLRLNIYNPPYIKNPWSLCIVYFPQQLN